MFHSSFQVYLAGANRDDTRKALMERFRVAGVTVRWSGDDNWLSSMSQAEVLFFVLDSHTPGPIEMMEAALAIRDKRPMVLVVEPLDKTITISGVQNPPHSNALDLARLALLGMTPVYNINAPDTVYTYEGFAHEGPGFIIEATDRIIAMLSNRTVAS